MMPSSIRPSQSSSIPLQVSLGTVHADGAAGMHALVQVPVPVEPHEVVQLALRPAAHVKPSSTVPSQSSSAPLHTSAGGAHAAPVGIAHALVHVPLPVVPHALVHVTRAPSTQAKL